MKASKHRSALQWVATVFEGTIRTMVGCFVVVIVFTIAIVFVSDFHFQSIARQIAIYRAACAYSEC